MPQQTAVGIFDPQVALVQATEFEGAEIHIPHAVVGFLQANVLARTADAYVAPFMVPADAAEGATQPCAGLHDLGSRVLSWRGRSEVIS